MEIGDVVPEVLREDEWSVPPASNLSLLARRMNYYIIHPLMIYE